MTDAPTTVKGKIAKIMTWASGKGFFLSFEGDENDYYKFGSCKYSEGQEVCFECKPGSNKWADKVEIVKEVKVGNATIDVNKIKQESFKSADTVYLTKAEADAVRQNSIERQSAIKSAAAIISRVVGTDSNWKVKMLAESTINLAHEFLEFIKDEEPKLPDPGEAD